MKELTQAEKLDLEVRKRATKIRGAYLDMSCDLEFLLVDIACICLMKDKTERENVRNIFLEQTYMSKKITIAEMALKTYNCSYYEKYITHFNKFRELTGWRNKFAHSIIKGDSKQGDFDLLIFQYIKDGEMKETPENFLKLLDKLKEYASFIHSMASEIIPILYYERHIGL